VTKENNSATLTKNESKSKRHSVNYSRGKSYHATPIPRKTLTAVDPVTLPRELSAESPCQIQK